MHARVYIQYQSKKTHRNYPLQHTGYRFYCSVIVSTANVRNVPEATL